MPWTKAARIQYQRSGLRYASDLTDAEWALIARKLPARHRLGRPREVDLREIVQAIFYILSSGCQWRALRREFPPYSTVRAIFTLGVTAADGIGSLASLYGKHGRSSAISQRRRLPSSIAKPLRQRRPEGLVASIPANGCMGASGTSSPIPTAFCSQPMSILRTFRMSMVRSPCSSNYETASRGFNMSLPIEFTAADS